jgi:tetratricopeptide (TPR) repeat protein
MAKAVNDFLINDMLASADPEIAQGRKITVEEVLDSASHRIDTAFPDQPGIEASIRDTIGTTYVNLGLHEAAEPHLREAESTRSRVLGDEHPDTLQTRARLADLLRRQGWFVKSEALARETLDAQRRVVGDDAPTTAITLNALGLVLRRQGRNGEANEAFREALEIRRRTLGEDHPDTLTSMNSLAKGLGDVGNCAEAEILYRETLELRRSTLGDEHPRTLESLSGLGPVLRCVGKRDEAEETIRQALDLQRRVLGEDHPDTLQSMYQLAGVIWTTGRLDEAEVLLKDCLEARRRVLGTAHLSVASTTDVLLRVLRARAKVEEAGPYVLRAMSETDKARYEDLHANPYELSAWAYALLTYEPTESRDPRKALSLAEKAIEVGGASAAKLRNVVIAYEQNGRLGDAIKTLRETIDGLGSEESYWRAFFETRLMHALRKGGYLDEAAGTLDAAVARAREAYGERQAQLVRKVTDLTLFLVANDRFLQHEWICGDLVQLQLGIIPTDAPGLVGFVVIYAAALVDQGRHTEAEPYLRHCLDIRESAFPDGHWHTAQVMSILGATLIGQGKFEEAEPMLLDAYSQMKVGTQAPWSELVAALKRIVGLYEAWGRQDHAARWQAVLTSAQTPHTQPGSPHSGSN